MQMGETDTVIDGVSVVVCVIESVGESEGEGEIVNVGVPDSVWLIVGVVVGDGEHVTECEIVATCVTVPETLPVSGRVAVSEESWDGLGETV